jgi:hypothetical protein
MSQKPVMENNPAQPDSGMSKLGVEPENRPAQLDSPANAGSNLKTCPYRPLDFKTSSAQRDSGISTLRMGEHCHTEGAEYTEKEILTKNIKNIMGCFMGRWGNESKSKMQNGPAQRHSRMSNLKIAFDCGARSFINMKLEKKPPSAMFCFQNIAKGGNK